MAVKIDGIIRSEAERKKINNQKRSPLKKRISGNKFSVGVEIFFIGYGSKLYEGIITKDLGLNIFEVKVVDRHKGSNEEELIFIKEEKNLKLLKK